MAYNEFFRIMYMYIIDIGGDLSASINLTKTINELWAFNLFDFTLNRLAELANQIPVILDMINKMTGNSSALSSVISMEAQLAYQTYTIQQFIIKQLQLFNGKCFRSLRYHLILSSFKNYNLLWFCIVKIYVESVMILFQIPHTSH